jgi:hypothetical protein
MAMRRTVRAGLIDSPPAGAVKDFGFFMGAPPRAAEEFIGNQPI